MVGKSFTNFSDLGAMLYQVDFQGPVGYCFNYSPQIRYTHYMLDDHLSASISVEYLSQSLSKEVATTSRYERMEQRYPTVPAYLQYNWGVERANHLRFSAICRPQSVYDTQTDKRLSRIGWGTQLSGTTAICSKLRLYFNGVYGRGISEYISDVYGSELEYTLNPNSKNGIETTPMCGWNAGVKIDLSDSVWVDFAYSEAIVGRDVELFEVDDYHRGRFASANIFYSATQNLLFATEYNWGQRTNMGGEDGKANRMYLMAQYNF